MLTPLSLALTVAFALCVAFALRFPFAFPEPLVHAQPLSIVDEHYAERTLSSILELQLLEHASSRDRAR